MPAVPRFGSVIYATDVRVLADFYSKVTSLHVRESTSEYVMLEESVYFLVVLQIPTRIAESITLDRPPRRRENTPIKLILPVSSIATARDTVAANGGELNPPEREWEFHGIRRCDGIDPEGNVFQLQEI
jgi:predicted enzyme related to lactoylglutathione lyase